MRRPFFLSFLTSFVFALPALAGECLYHSADWSPEAAPVAAPGPLVELRFVAIYVDENGALIIDMVSRQYAYAPSDGLLAHMRNRLEKKISRGEARHEMFKGGGTPFDMKFNQDTEIVYMLKPTAWRWADASEDQFFLKPYNKTGIAQHHNPFTAARRIGENMMAVTFDYAAAYEGCAWSYNLGVVATQIMGGETYETPLIIDPESSSGTGGDIDE